MSHPQSYEILLVPGFVEETPDDSGTGTAGTGSGTGSGTDAAETGADAAGTGAARSAAPPEDTAIRSAVVEATGETGASGYPRYAGEGVVADIDPATHAVEAVLVDGAELDYGLSVRIREQPRTPAGPGEPGRPSGAGADDGPRGAIGD